jgi:hypothetical protein
VARPKRAVKCRTSEEVPFSAGVEAGVIPMLPVAPRAEGPATRSRRWGVILAGGDGTRLQQLTRPPRGRLGALVDGGVAYTEAASGPCGSTCKASGGVN